MVLDSRRRRPWLGLALVSALSLGQMALRRMYAPHFPDVALHAGLALVSRPRRVLAIAAHPAALEWHLAGTLFLLARAGGAITAAVLTAGDAGTPGRQNAAQVRGREAQQAGAVLGYERVVQLDLPAGGLTEHPGLAPALQQVWADCKPEVVLAPDPRGLLFPAAPDTAAAGFAAVMAGRARLREAPWLLLYGTRRPNVLVDITEVLPEKMTAIQAHRSQLPGPDWLLRPVIRRLGRQFRAGTAAYYVEGLYRVL